MNEHETTYKVEYKMTDTLGQESVNVIRGFESQAAARQASIRLAVGLGGMPWRKLEFLVSPE